MSESVADCFEQGVAWHRQGDLVAARACYDRVLALQGRHFGALHLSGLIALENGEPQRALELLEQALALEPDFALALFSLGRAQKLLQQPDAAVRSFERVIALMPGHVAAYINLAHVLQSLKRPAEMLSCLDRVLALEPGHATALRLRGDALMELARHAEALASYDRALELEPDQAGIWVNRGAALKELRRLSEALASFDSALKFDPECIVALTNRGRLLIELMQFDLAIQSFDRALRLKPDAPKLWLDRGVALYSLMRYEDALSSFQIALNWQPDLSAVWSLVLFMKSMMCDWHGQEEWLSSLVAAITQGDTPAGVLPIALMGLTDDPLLLQQVSKSGFSERVLDKLGPIAARPRSNKIHVAYISADFREHPVGYLLPGFLEEIDRERFELTALALGPDDDSGLRRRIRAAFDRFIDVGQRSCTEVAHLCRELGVDIAVDLMGYTQGAYTEALAMRCAPVQINWLGYPGSMAASFIDYIVADGTLIGPDDVQFYTEKVIFLPDTLMPFDKQREVSSRVFSRAECGLPASGFVFCCFNRASKISAQTFDVWMRVLKRVPDSVLWLAHATPTTETNLLRAAQVRGVAAQRLVFAPKIAMAEHLARHGLADLQLDTWPYNTHSTAFEALRSGVPVLTRFGRSFPSRVAASLLKACGLPELIVENHLDFEELAVTLALQPERMAELKRRLAASRLTQPLFDVPRFTRHMESAYVQAMERYWSGARPDHIVIAPG